MFLFGLTAEQVAGSRDWYDPRWHYEHEPETRQALDLIFSGHFNRREPGLYEPIRDALLTHGDYYMHLADLAPYAEAQARVSTLYADRTGWGRKAILNVARSGKFSSDRTIAEYAGSIWGAPPPDRLARPAVPEADPNAEKVDHSSATKSTQSDWIPKIAPGRPRGAPGSGESPWYRSESSARGFDSGRSPARPWSRPRFRAVRRRPRRNASRRPRWSPSSRPAG